MGTKLIRERRIYLLNAIKGLSKPITSGELYKIINLGYRYKTFRRDINYLKENKYIKVKVVRNHIRGLTSLISLGDPELEDYYI